MGKSEIVDNSETQTGVCKAASHEKLSVKQKLKTANSQKRKETDDLEIVIKTEEEEELEENLDSGMDQMTKVKVGRKKGKKEARRTKKMKKRQPEMKELMVGRRMASLNASAMMQVNYSPPIYWGGIHQLVGDAKSAVMTDQKCVRNYPLSVTSSDWLSILLPKRKGITLKHPHPPSITSNAK